jgi:hypothetical protein
MLAKGRPNSCASFLCGERLQIIIPPGQEHRREATWTSLLADIGKGRFRGVILLAAYGFDTLGQIAVEDHKLFKGSREQFFKDYLEDKRRDELAILSQLVPHIRVNQDKLWVLTLIAKQDLWWNETREVEKYYRQGEYGKELERMVAQQNSQRFRHEFCFASLVISNFKTAKGECLKPNVAGYDHQLQIETLRRLFETVDALRKWEIIS